MSLKAFHLVFVTCMTALTSGCGCWLLHRAALEPDRPALRLMAYLSFAACAAVLVYGRYFWKKVKGYSLI